MHGGTVNRRIRGRAPRAQPDRYYLLLVLKYWNSCTASIDLELDQYIATSLSLRCVDIAVVKTRFFRPMRRLRRWLAELAAQLLLCALVVVVQGQRFLSRPAGDELPPGRASRACTGL